MNDGDIKTTTKTWKQKAEVEDLQGGFPYAGNVFSAAWVRRSLQNDNGSDWFILDSRHRFLLNFRLLLAVICLIIEALK